MKLIKVIKFKDISAEDVASFSLRLASRAIIFDGEGKIAILHVKALNYYKLPGGGLENAETPEEALRRECLEEAGCKIKITGELGEVIEYRDKWALKQISSCYLAQLEGKKGEPEFTADEKNSGFELIWANPSHALELIAGAEPIGYEGAFIKARDEAIIQELFSLQF